MKPHPPIWPLRFLRWFCREDFLEEIEGDLTEIYFREHQKSPAKARRQFTWGVIKHFRSEFMKPIHLQSHHNYKGMIKNYFVIAWRSLLKNKLHSFINVAGLSAGMAVSILIGLWIYNELSFDKYHQNYDHIAQVMQSQVLSNEVQTQMQIPIPLGDKLRTTYGNNFKRVVMSSDEADHILANGETKIIKPGRYMQHEAPQLFSLKILQGSEDALKEPASIILSQSTAIALFGSKDPINQIVTFDNDTTVKVTGVYEDLPANTTLHNLSFIVPWEMEPKLKKNIQNWDNNGWEAFVQVADNVKMQTASSKIKEAKASSIDVAGQKFKPVIFLQPMSKWHLYSEFKNGVNTGGEIQYVRMFSIIGAIVVLLACINFMNLSTARSEKRAKEVGIRKTIGSLQKQLVTQFFVESLLVAFISFILSVVLIVAVLPVFNQIANAHIAMPWPNPYFWLLCIGFTFFVGLIAGSYPAFYLSSFKPIKVLKGSFKAGRLAAIPRKSLVVLQFAASVVLIIWTIVVYNQIQFVKNRPVGYNREGLINIKTLTFDIYNHFDVFRNDLVQTGAVEEAAESSTPVTESNNQQGNFDWEGRDKSGTQNFATVGVSKGYGRTIGWQFVDGRDYRTGADGADAMAFVINESAAKMMGFKDPIGKIVHWTGYDFQIIGVVKDMVMQSPFDPIQPTIFYMSPFKMRFLNIKMKAGTNVGDGLQKIRQVYAQYNPGQPFDYKFADEEYARKFDIQERVGKLTSFFSLLAIFISCIGIFGMASFIAAQRTKEISLRKVLGASVLNLWALLSKEFVILVLLALLMATPIAYYFMHNWLQNYAFHTGLPWWIFAVTGAGVLMITLLTVSFQSIKAAMANPVKSLRSE